MTLKEISSRTIKDQDQKKDDLDHAIQLMEKHDALLTLLRGLVTTEQLLETHLHF